MKCIVILLSCFFALGSSRSLTLLLKNYNGATPNVVDNIEAGSNLYLSSNDKISALSKISVTNNGNVITLDQLVNRFNSDSSKIGWSLSGTSLSISTTNSDNKTAELTGFLFVSTAAQANDPNFLVYVVKDLLIDRSQTAQSNLVFLNVQTSRDSNTNENQPFYSARITDIVQPNTTKMHIYANEPQAGYDDPTNNNTIKQQIFQNPIIHSRFFDNIEPLEISQMKVWYLKAIGGIKMSLSSEWQDQLNYTTTAITTTGLISNQLWTFNSTVHLQLNPSNTRSTGIIMTCNLILPLNVTFFGGGGSIVSEYGVKNDLTYYSQPFEVNPLQVTEISVTMNNAFTGLYYVQYYGIDGVSIPSTAAPSTISTSAVSPISSTTIIPPTSTEIQTTTRGATKFYGYCATLITIFISILRL